MQTDHNNTRIAKNTIFLYFRMLFILIIGLFTSRVNLDSLGIEDFGIYNVVGGFVSMFAIFSNSLASSISRFLTYEIGQSNKERLQRVFSTTVNVQFLMAIIIFFIAELCGIWFLNNKLVISPDRIVSAHWVFQCSLISFVINLISVPYNAAIIAHERMNIFAYISIFEVVAKLLICYYLYISPYDKLIIYSILILLLSIVLRIIYGIYCKKNFNECVYKPIIDIPLIKKITVFAGWSSFTMIAYTCYTSGLNILLNLFFGPIVNAARGIAVQVQTSIQGFCKNFQIAVNPQIIKSYASNDIKHVYYLIYKSSKFSFFLMLLLTLPVILEIDVILYYWLKEVPEHTNNFIRLLLVIVLVDSIGGPLYTTQQATGDIKKFQILTGTLMLMILPVSYIFLRLGYFSEIIFIVYLIILSLVQLISIFLIHKSIGMPLKEYFNEVLVKIIFVSICSCVLPTLMCFILKDNLISFLLIIIISICSTILSIYYCGLSRHERTYIYNLILRHLRHFKN